MNHKHGLMLSILLAASHTAAAAAIDEIRIDVSHDACEGFGAKAMSFIVYATNASESRSVDGNFKYDSSPAQQHFILFDANLDPITDRFPKFYTRRLGPRERAAIGCTLTYRASPQPPGPLHVPVVITVQGASYVEPNAPVASPEGPRGFAAFFLQGGVNECGAGAKPPGMLFLLNLHPYAHLSASMNVLDEHGNRSAMTSNLPPLSTLRAGCSNGNSRPGPITGVTLEVPAIAAGNVPTAPAPEAKASPPERHPTDSPAAAPLFLGTILATQNVCAGSMPPGWIKINDAWNPTICGNPAALTYNIWTIQRLSDQPMGAVIQACKASVPDGWAIVGTSWNPTVCGHPATHRLNVMAIKRLN